MKIYCQTLLQGDTWQNDVVLEIAQDGMISSIGKDDPNTADYRIHGIVIPGMPNAHSHSFQRLIAGLTGPKGNHSDSFWSWRTAMYRCANGISPDQFGDVAKWVFTEMLKAGYTSCAEFHYLHHQADGRAYADPAEMSGQLISAAKISGIAMTLLPVLYCSAGFGKDRVNKEQRRFANTADSYLRLLDNVDHAVSANPLLALGLAPHSLRAVPAEVLQEVLQSWPHKESPIHIHIAEQPAEVEDCIRHLGARPVEWLLDQFPVDQRWNLVHATHLSDTELKLAAASQATAVLCPTTEADLGDGVFRTSDWLSAGGRFAIGSDSNVRISVTEELRLLEYNERLVRGRRNVLTTADSTCGRFLYQHAAQSGSAALGQAVGRLEPGYRADFLVLNDTHELLCGRQPDAALDSWVFAGDKSMLASVWVAGHAVIEQGHHPADATLRSAFLKTINEIQT
ncbi:MAG: formimidoylglutamate deiminase [Xanthomonadales bacterium]|nr:formimidoylglutamate deiminase [Xanthomonadales bacterium]